MKIIGLDMDTQRILIDTSIAVEGGEAIIAKLEKIAPVFVTDIVLQELDGHKNNANGAVAFQAREFFRRLGNSNGIALAVLPLDGMKLEKTDTLRKMFLGATPLHVIVRKPYKSRDINDSKIIEIAKDYNMKLVTLDMAQRVRAISEGVDVDVLRIKAEEKKENIFSKLLFVFGLLCILGGVASLIFHFVEQTNTKFSFFFSFFSFVLGMLCVAIGGFFSVRKNYYNTDKDTNSNNKTDVLSDSSFNLLEGNLFHNSLHG